METVANNLLWVFSLMTLLGLFVAYWMWQEAMRLYEEGRKGMASSSTEVRKRKGQKQEGHMYGPGMGLQELMALYEKGWKEDLGEVDVYMFAKGERLEAEEEEEEAGEPDVSEYRKLAINGHH